MSGADPIEAAIALAVGLIFGSFANVCVHRIPEGESIAFPGSRCPRCGAAVRWYDNVPIVSWIVLRARCRDCRAPISAVYPAVEALVGVGFLGAYLKFGPSIDAFATAWLVFTCVALTVIDARLFLLPDALTYPGMAAGFAFAAARGALARSAGGSLLGSFFDDRPAILGALGGLAVGAAIPFVARGAYMIVRRIRGGGAAPAGGEPLAAPDDLSASAATPGAAAPPAGGAEGETDDDIAEAALEEGMGLGDVKMLAMVGLFLGARMTLVTILVGSILGCLLVIPWLLLRGRSFRTPVPFGPFIALGAVVAAFAGPELSSWYSDLVVRMIS
ncbi:MAG TPA: prepilin peptidase [Verrucomicrobiae bacterium]|nr:prepilin peptidase [Verrucomicrobiae bacterium]